LSYPWSGPIEGQPGRQIFNLWEQLLDGGKPRQLTKFAEPIFVHAWSRDGKTLAVLTGKYTSDVVLISEVR
jgi:Tol biopolymer transport system component